MTKSLDPVALITGAASGFGRDLALELSGRGFHVIATDINGETLSDLSQVGIQTEVLDVTKQADIDRVFSKVAKDQGRLDVLVANAGFGNFGSIEETKSEAVRRMFEVNLFGVERCIRAALPMMRAQTRGRILVTTSIVSHVSLAGLGWYAATKHAARAMANALRNEVRWLGIRVSLIEPGTSKTGFDSVAFGALDDARVIEDYGKVMTGFERRLRLLYRLSPGTKKTVRAMVHAATSRRPRAVYPASWDVRGLKLFFYGLPRSWSDSVILALAKTRSKDAV
jgi:NAD(P)-dependent dehydrogenase (short-subunit alcohol dehydrogenase family)